MLVEILPPGREIKANKTKNKTKKHKQKEILTAGSVKSHCILSALHTCGIVNNVHMRIK